MKTTFKHSNIVRQHILNSCFLKYHRNKTIGVHKSVKQRFQKGNELHEKVYKNAKEWWLIEEPQLYPIDAEHAIQYTPDMLIPEHVIHELKFTKVHPKQLPKASDIRQAIFYASASGLDVLLRYFDWDGKFIKENSYTKVPKLLEEFRARAILWFFEKENRPQDVEPLRNPWPNECKWCPYASGVCYKWLKDQKSMDENKTNLNEI